MKYCRVCGKPNCKKHFLNVGTIRKIETFSGSSPPEIFIGRYNYPNVYAGILSPQEYGDTQILSSQELWHKEKLSIPQIKELRNKLIYGRAQTNIRNAIKPNHDTTRLIPALQEVAMASKSISAEFKLKRPIEANKEKDTSTPLIKNAVQVKSVRLEENPVIERKVDYLVNDTDAKSQIAMLELEKSSIPTSTIIKILSAGLLGLKTRRKLVPTRWSITAVDDALSKEKLKRIKFYPEISNILVFHAEYIGNNYHFLLLPDKFSFEVIEINQSNPNLSWHDQEGFFGRKNYAESVTGAYYANRLALCEHLEKIKRQASCIVLREIGEEYTQSMGVGVLREISREAFNNQSEAFSSLNEAIQAIQSRIKLPIQVFTNHSLILKNYGKQSRLSKWF